MSLLFKSIASFILIMLANASYANICVVKVAEEFNNRIYERFATFKGSNRSKCLQMCLTVYSREEGNNFIKKDAEFSYAFGKNPVCVGAALTGNISVKKPCEDLEDCYNLKKCFQYYKEQTGLKELDLIKYVNFNSHPRGSEIGCFRSDYLTW